MNIAEKLTRYYPDAQWSLNGDVYAGLIWHGPGEKPTEQELSALDFDVAKDAKRETVNHRLTGILAGGYSHDFGSPHGIKSLQTRNADDRINWMTSQAAYSAAVMQGFGAVLGANFRTEDNTDIVLSYADGLGVLLAMAAWGASVYAASWALKNAIDAAEDETALDAIDIEAGWPA